MAQARAANYAARRGLLEREILDVAVVVALAYSPPKIEHRIAASEWGALVQRRRGTVLHVAGEQRKDSLEIIAIECVAGTVERGLKNAATYAFGQPAETSSRKRRDAGRADLDPVGEWAFASQGGLHHTSAATARRTPLSQCATRSSEEEKRCARCSEPVALGVRVRLSDGFESRLADIWQGWLTGYWV